MILSRRAALNGVQLDEVDERIIIQSVKPAAGKTTITAVSLNGRDGQRVTGSQRDTIDVEIDFGLWIRKEQLEDRAALLETVNGWAASASLENGGAWLTVGHKPNRRMRVYLAEPAEEGDLREWAKNFKLVFRAYGVPYWQEEEPERTATSDTTSIWNGTLSVGGNVKTTADVRLRNDSGATMQTASVWIGQNTMSFEELALGANETLVIDHDYEGFLRIRIQSAGGSYRSAMDKRTGGSANDFLVTPGVTNAGFRSQRACAITAKAYGRFL